MQIVEIAKTGLCLLGEYYCGAAPALILEWCFLHTQRAVKFWEGFKGKFLVPYLAVTGKARVFSFSKLLRVFSASERQADRWTGKHREPFWFFVFGSFLCLYKTLLVLV